jgi:hypothetical protein
VGSRLLGLDANGDVVAANAVAFESEFDNGSQSGAYAVDWNNGQHQRITLTGNPTLSFTALDQGGAAKLTLVVIQDGTGGRQITWPGSVLWPNGVTQSLANDPNAISIFSFYWDGTSYYGVSSTNFI